MFMKMSNLFFLFVVGKIIEFGISCFYVWNLPKNENQVLTKVLKVLKSKGSPQYCVGEIILNLNIRI